MALSVWPGDGGKVVGVPAASCAARRQSPSCTVLWPHLCRSAIVAGLRLLYRVCYETAHSVTHPSGTAQESGGAQPIRHRSPVHLYKRDSVLFLAWQIVFIPREYAAPVHLGEGQGYIRPSLIDQATP